MSSRRANILTAGAGIALGLLFVTLAVASSPLPRNAEGCLTPLHYVLWMHSEVPGMAGDRWWYNTTITLNKSIPFTDVAFGFVDRENDTVYPPPTFSFAVYRGASPIAGFNLTTHNWTAGHPQDLVSGDWFGVQIINQNLIGDRLVAFGLECYSSTVSVVFQ